MKRRKILYLFPLAALVLSGCTFQEAVATVKSFLSNNIYHPAKDFIDGLSGKTTEEEEQKDQPSGEGDKPSGEGEGGEGGGESQTTVHAGTLADPFDAADAKVKAKDLEDGGFTEEAFYIRGVVQSIDEEFSTSYGNYTFSIEDGFKGYRLKKGESYEKFAENDIEVGDTVLMYGKIKLHKETFELDGTTAGQAYVVSVTKPAPEGVELVSIKIEGNPKSQYIEGDKYGHEGLSVTALYDDESTKDVTNSVLWSYSKETAAVGDTEVTITASFSGKEASITATVTVVDSSTTQHAGTEEDPYTGTDASIVAGKLETGGVTDEFFYIQGTVQSFEEDFNPTYGNYSFKIDGGFIGWRLKNGPEFKLFEEGDLEIGDAVLMYAKIQNYSGKPETSGGYIVSIDKPVKSVSVTPESLTLEVNEQASLTASVTPAKANQEVNWTIDQTSEVVEFANGKVLAKAEGSATITATSVKDPTKSASCEVTVNPASKELLSITIEGAAAKTEYVEGESYSAEGLTVIAHYSDDTNPDVTNDAEISLSKEVAELGDEKITVTATYGSKEATKDVSVVVTEKQPIVAPGAYEIQQSGFYLSTEKGSKSQPLGTADESKAVQFNFALKEGTLDTYTITVLESDPVEYLYVTADNNGLRIGSTACEWKIEEGLEGKGEGILMSAVDSNSDSRYLTLYKGTDGYSDFRIYKSPTQTRDDNTQLVPAVVKTLDSISVTSNPTKTDYFVGESLDLAGLEVSAHYVWENGSEDIVLEDTQYTVDQEGAFTSADAENSPKTITVSFGGKTATFEVTVTVKAAELTGITIDGDLAKDEYVEGESYSASGLTVTAHYDDQSTVDVTNAEETQISLSKETAEVGDTSLTVTASYKGFEKAEEYTVSVSEKKGTETNPYSVVEARAAIDGTESGKTAYVTGIVTRIAYAWANGSMSFYFSDDGAKSNEIEAYKLAATSDPGVEVGDIVLVKGTLTKYNTTYELGEGCTLENLTKATVESVVISGTAAQTEYYVGDTYNHEGLSATANLNTGVARDVTSSATWEIDPATASSSDESITITATYGNVQSAGFVVNVSVSSSTPPTPQTYTDTLTRDTTGVTGTSYSDWSGKTLNSTAVYAGQSAGGNSSIQLRSKNSNSGIITTASGGKITKISVVFNSSTSNGQTLDIYGSNTAFTSPTQLYGSGLTKLGSIVNGTSTELTITGSYAYVGVRSNNGAIYLTSITFEWSK